MSYFYWDPSRAMIPWNLPFLGRPIFWYGFFFACGFSLAYIVLFLLLKYDKGGSLGGVGIRKIADSLALYAGVGILAGARLFDLIFYQDWGEILKDPLSVVRIWEGGLASHGGFLGCFLALSIFQRLHRELSLLHLFDLTFFVSGIAGFFIRLGNFFNQEVLGVPTELTWGVIFGHPIDGGVSIPRHPVQLYEAFFYLTLFLCFWFLRKRYLKWREGLVAGIVLTCAGGFRFIIEFFKEEQSIWLTGSSLTMGQWLSFPFLLFGLFLLFHKQFFNVAMIKRE